MEQKCSEDKCPFRLLKRLTDAGLVNFPIHRADVQDGVLVKVVLVIEDKETVVTL